MNIIDTLITDRTGGHYNATDLNRVGAAVAYIDARLRAAGYLTGAQPKTDWTIADIPTPAQLTRYAGDIQRLRDALAVYPTTPAAPGDMDALTVQEANDIERILADVDGLITSMIAAYRHSGTFQSGQGGLRV